MVWEKLKSLFDIELFAMISPTLLVAVFIPNVLINPWIVISIFCIAIWSYLLYCCNGEKFSKDEAKRYLILNSIPATFFCIFVVIMKLWVLADI